MAILSIEQVLSGMQPPVSFLKLSNATRGLGYMHSLLFSNGIPGPASAYSPGMSGVALTSLPGQLPFSNPISGNSNLVRFTAGNTVQNGDLFLLDRLWHNSGINVTTITPQSINSVSWPARDLNGSANGQGISIALETITATTNAGDVSINISYTNSNGASNRIGTLSFPSNAVAGTFVPFILQEGDVGVRSIESITLGSSLVTGSVSLVAYRTVARLGLGLINTGASLDFVTSSFPRLLDNSVLFLVWNSTSVSSTTINGQLILSQG